MKYLITVFHLLFFCNLFAQTTSEQNLAMQYYQNEEYSKALVLFEKLYEKNAESSVFYRYYYNSLLKTNDYEKAEKVVKKAIKNHQQETFYLIDLGNVYESAGDVKSADAEYNKAIKQLLPIESQINQTANAFIGNNKIDFAIKVFEQGQQLLKSPFAFCFELASLNEQKGNIEKAVSYYLDYALQSGTSVQLVQNKLQENLSNIKFFDPFKEELLNRLQSSNAPLAYADLLIWAFVQKKDFKSAFIQTKALDKRLNENGYRVLNLAQSAVAEKQYDAAIEMLQYVLQKGNSNPNYAQAKQELLQARKAKITESINYTKQDISLLNAEYESYVKEFGLNRNTANVLLDQAAIQAFYLYNIDSAIAITEALLDMPQLDKNLKANVKLDLGDYYIMNGDVYEPVLLYTQVEKDFKDQPLAELARFKNAKLSYYKGDFEWAQAQLTILKSATTELVANDALELSVFIQDNLGLDTSTYPVEMYAKADLLYYQNERIKALKTLDSIIDIFPNHALADDILFFKAEAMHDSKQDSIAAAYLSKILAFYKDDLKADDATFLLATLYENSLNDKEKAKQLYEDLITNFKDSIYVTEARKRYRKLRGDAL